MNAGGVRDYFGRQIWQTVFDRDRALWVANFAGIGGGVAIAGAELAVRARRRSIRPGVAAIAIGSMLCVYSLFGLVFGVLAIAPIGVLVILSGLPVIAMPENVSATGDAGPG